MRALPVAAGTNEGDYYFHSIFLEYNLTAPEYNLAAPQYNLAAPEYNLAALEYNLAAPEYNLTALVTLLAFTPARQQVSVDSCIQVSISTLTKT